MTLLACYSSVVKGTKLPQFSWTLEDDGSIRVKSQDKPERGETVAGDESGRARFPVATIGPVWKSTDLKDEGGGVYIAKVEKPEKGWTAFFAELTYENGTDAVQVHHSSPSRSRSEAV